MKKYLKFNMLVLFFDFLYKENVTPQIRIFLLNLQKHLAISAMGKHNMFNNTHSASDLSVPVWVFL